MTEGLQLSERQPGYGHITVLVGPDGGGKSFLAKQMAGDAPNAILIDGTHPNNWPVTDREKNKISRLKEKYEGFKYYGLLSLALHKMVDGLAKEGKDVIIDSEQTFKWLMWEDMNGKLDKAVSTLTSNKINVVLPDLIKYVVPEADNFEEQAKLIWERQSGKPESEKSSVDPKNLDEVKTRLLSSEHVIIALEKLGVEIEGKPSWVK